MADGQQLSYENRSHFYGIASRLMRQGRWLDEAGSRKAISRNGGCLVEQGSHDELLALDGPYAALVASQLEQVQDGLSPACLRQ